MNLDEKLRIAAVLEEMGVDIIEAGFPIASQGDFEAVTRDRRHGDESTVVRPGARRRKDIDRAWEALKGAKQRRASTPSSPPAAAHEASSCR
jgi:2-isopropylmalate synthase